MIKTYVGNSGVKGVPKIYAGVSGVKKVIRAYAGVSGTPKLVFIADWWRPEGVSLANVLAAYQFKGRSSDTEALKDLTGHGYGLGKTSQEVWGTTYTPTLNSSYGYYFAEAWYGNCGYLNNTNLNNQNIKCIIIRYSGLSRQERGFLVGACGSHGRAQIYAATGYYNNSEHYVNIGTPGFVSSYGGNGSIKYRSGGMNSGVICVNFDSNQMYINGSLTAESLTTKSGVFTDLNTKKTFGNTHSGMSDWNNQFHAAKYIQAAAFYSIELSANQQREVYKRITEL